MIRFLIITSVLASVQASSRIIHGTATSIENLPYQAAILTFDVHKCGATIITTTVIISAAHCTEGLYLKEATVRVGSTYRGKGGIVVPIERFVQHPKYSKLLVNYDFAVIFLKTPLVFSPSIQPVGLPELNESEEEGSLAVASGWGRLYEDGPVPELLQMISIPIMSDEQCKKAYGKDRITEVMMCAGLMDGSKDACKQDSGGPLVANNKLVGIISWAIGCGRKGKPGVYSKVSAVRDWIDQVMES